VKEWLANLAPRERRILAGGAVALVLLLFYLVIWQPLHSGVAQMRTSVAEQRDTLRWMREAAAEVKSLATSGAQGGAGLGGRSLLAVVDQSARSSNLGPALKRVEPEGQNSVRVRVEGASFDAMVGWLSGLARSSQVFATSLSIERADASGQVDARLTLHTDSE
jgi:general secretion pathway protein M